MKDHIEVEARSERHGSETDREKSHDREVKDKERHGWNYIFIFNT